MVHHGRDRVQIGAWRSRNDTANLVPFPDGDALSPQALDHALETARSHGFAAAYPAAMSEAQAVPFVAAGFELLEELHLLRRPLDPDLLGPPDKRGELRRGRRTDFAQVLELDALAFDGFWQFDRASLADAMRATPRHRFHVTRTDPVVGYHVTGLAGASAYLQRVAVHPDAQGQGWGRQLVDDALRWSATHGARMMHVNTQLTNQRAFELYERNGFVLADERLQVLRRTL